jgi:hypothetical protein
LLVDVKKCIWARSNIYWQEVTDVLDSKYPGYLTFVTDVSDLTKQGLQGVLFKWGSLVGISPALTNGSNAFSGATPVYIPTLVYDSGEDTYANSTWERNTSHSYTSGSWKETASGVAENAATNVPYLDGSYTSSGSVAFGRDNRYAIEAEQNTDEMYEGLRGDICQYLSTKTKAVPGDYRLPTSNELAPASGWTRGGDHTTNLGLGNHSGTVDFLDINRAWLKNADMGNVIFPAPGFRDNANHGGLFHVNAYGMYWSGSAYDGTTVYYLRFVNGFASGNYLRSYALSVRCVQNLN